MAAFDDLVSSLSDGFLDALQQQTRGRALRWVGLGAEEEGLYLAFETEGDDALTMHALIDLGFGNVESTAFQVAERKVVDFDAVEFEQDHWDGRDFIMRCALAFVALALEDELREDATKGFQVDVFEDLDTPRIKAAAPIYFCEMPTDDFLAEFDDHCDDEAMYDFARECAESGWTGVATDLARKLRG